MTSAAALANKRWLDAVPGRREAHNKRNVKVKAARQKALQQLAAQFPTEFQALYEAEKVRRGIPLRGRGRPKMEA